MTEAEAIKRKIFQGIHNLDFVVLKEIVKKEEALLKKILKIYVHKHPNSKHFNNLQKIFTEGQEGYQLQYKNGLLGQIIYEMNDDELSIIFKPAHAN